MEKATTTKLNYSLTNELINFSEWESERHTDICISNERIKRRYFDLDAYLEEELYDILTYCIQNPNASDLELKRRRVEEIGKELHSDGGVDSMENMFYSIEFRIKDELKKDAKPYRSWWNGISEDWKC